MRSHFKNLKAWALLLPATLVLFLVGFFPLMTVVNFSLQDSFGGGQFFWVGTRWFEDALSNPAFWATLGRTMLFSAMTLSLQFALGLWIARKLYHRQKGGGAFLGFLALPLLTPWIVVGFLWRHGVDAQVGLFGVSLASVGLAPDLNSVIWVWATIIAMDVWHWTSLTVILAYAGYASIPTAYFQAAKIDGASAWAMFRHIELPNLSKVLIVALLLRVADSLMIHTEPMMVSRGGPHVSSTFFSQDLIQTALIQFDLGPAGALSVIYLLVVVPLSWLLYKMMARRHG